MLNREINVDCSQGTVMRFLVAVTVVRNIGYE